MRKLIARVAIGTVLVAILAVGVINNFSLRGNPTSYKAETSYENVGRDVDIAVGDSTVTVSHCVASDTDLVYCCQKELTSAIAEYYTALATQGNDQFLKMKEAQTKMSNFLADQSVATSNAATPDQKDEWIKRVCGLEISCKQCNTDIDLILSMVPKSKITYPSSSPTTTDSGDQNSESFSTSSSDCAEGYYSAETCDICEGETSPLPAQLIAKGDPKCCKECLGYCCSFSTTDNIWKWRTTSKTTCDTSIVGSGLEGIYYPPEKPPKNALFIASYKAECMARPKPNQASSAGTHPAAASSEDVGTEELGYCCYQELFKTSFKLYPGNYPPARNTFSDPNFCDISPLGVFTPEKSIDSSQKFSELKNQCLSRVASSAASEKDFCCGNATTPCKDTALTNLSQIINMDDCPGGNNGIWGNPCSKVKYLECSKFSSSGNQSSSENPCAKYGIYAIKTKDNSDGTVQCACEIGFTWVNKNKCVSCSDRFTGAEGGSKNSYCKCPLGTTWKTPLSNNKTEQSGYSAGPNSCIPNPSSKSSAPPQSSSAASTSASSASTGEGYCCYYKKGTWFGGNYTCSIDNLKTKKSCDILGENTTFQSHLYSDAKDCTSCSTTRNLSGQGCCCYKQGLGYDAVYTDYDQASCKTVWGRLATAANWYPVCPDSAKIGATCLTTPQSSATATSSSSQPSQYCCSNVQHGKDPKEPTCGIEKTPQTCVDFTSGEFTWSDSRWVNLDECKACNVSQESSSAPLSPFSASASPQSSSSKSNPISSSSSTSSNDTKKYVAAKGGAEPGYCCKITTKTTALSNISLLAAAAVAAKGTCEEDKVSLEICQDLGATAGKDDNTEGRLFPTIIACDAACPNPCGNGKPDEGEKCDNGKSSELDPAKDPVCKDPNACGKTAAKTLAVNIPANVIKNYDVVTTKKLWKQAIIDADACNEKCEKVTKPVYCGDGILDKKGLDANEVDQPEEECDHGWYKNDKADVEPGGCDDRAMTCGKNGPNIPANIIAAYKAGEVLHKDWLKLINEKDACTFDCKNFKGKRGVMPKDKKDNNGENQIPPPGGGGMPPGGGGGNPGNGGNQNVPNPPKDTTANPSNPSGDSCPSPNGMIDGQCYPPCKETIPAPYTCPVNCPSGPCPLKTPGPQKNCAYSCVASSASHSSSASVPKCGNGKVDSGEDCDNGLACTSGARQGTVCTSDNQCKSISAAHFCKMDMESHPIRGICDDGVTPCMSGIDCADTYPCGYNLLKDPSCNASCKRASSSSRSSLSSRASASSVHPACSILCSARSCFLCTSKNQQCIIPDMSKLPVSTATAQLLNGGGQAAGFDCASGSKTGFITCPCGGSSSSTSSIPRVAVCGNGRIDLGESCDNGGICTGEAIGNDGKMRICYKDSDCFVARGKCSAGTCSDGVPCNQDVDCIDQYDCLYNVGKDLTCSAQCKITGVSSSRSGGSTASIQSTSSKGASLISKGSVASVPSSLKSAFSSSRISSQSSSKISSSISSRSSAVSSRSSTASRTKVCGNGRIDLGEQCDNGGACLGTYSGKICYQDSDCFVPRGNCTLGLCSDGAPCSQNADCVDQYECAYNTAKDLTCSALCKRTSSSSSRSSSSSSSATGICGNGVINTGEECDDGSQNSWVPGAHCLPTCKLNLTIPLCGNRVIDGSEQCDDGNRVNNDGCSSVCTKEVAKALCGNGIIEAPEQCDIGSNNGKAGYSCSGSCTLITSGTTTSYGYSYSFPTGPSTTTTSISTTTTTPSLPSTTGNPAFCGNAVLNVGEQCDDGNAISGDGCSDSCKRETTMTTGNAFCGNGRLDAGEECDDANRRDLDGCSANCFLERGACGDGIVQHALGEQCEPTLPLDSPFYTCDTQCHFVLQFCGNGILDPGEECDEGLRNSDAPNATCRVHCTITRCGDRILDRGEECDDGNLVNGDGCDRFCFRESGAAISPSSSSPRPGVQPGTNPLPSVRPSLPGTPGQQGGSTLATLTPIATSHAPAGSTGPVTASVMAAGAAFGFAWMRRKGLKR